MPGNVADTILAILADRGVKSIYGVSGDAIFPLLDALSRQDRIKYYGTAFEAGAAFMASYEAKLTGKPGVCVATSGPGVANLINGLADAYFDRAPVLAITGQVGTRVLGTNAKQYFNQQQLVKTFARKSDLVVNPEAVIPLLLSALETAAQEKTVVHLSVPEDVFQMPAPDARWPRVDGQSTTMDDNLDDNLDGNLNANSTGDLAASLDQTASQLNNAQRPLLIVGRRNQGIGKSSIALAEKIGAGIVIAQQAKGVLPDDHPLVLGGIGEAYAPKALAKADTLLLIGDASFEWDFLPKNAPLIQLVDTPDLLAHGRIDRSVIGNLHQLLKLLLEKAAPRKNQSWLDEIALEKKALDQQLSVDAQNNQTPIHPARLIAALSKTVAKNAIISSDIGGFMHWFDRGFRAREQTLLISSHWRSMGSGIPAAISAKIACPEKQALALIGDGGFLMSMGELLTAVKYRLPIAVVVANNHQYGLEKHKMQARGMTSVGNDILAPDFSAFANASGAKGFRVEKPEQLEDTLNTALNCGEPAVVDAQLADIPLPNL
ncbi:MAG: thiamine pyrophosphate-binding protein [Syntrophothermus sp.]